MDSAPEEVSFVMISESLSILFIAELSLLMTDDGVFAGATIPIQDDASKPGKPDSLMVGVLGNNSSRFGLADARARKRPDLICGKAVATSKNITGICPEMRSSTAGPAPL